MATLEAIMKIWPVVVFLLGLAVTMGGYVVRVRNAEQAVKDMSGKLYRKDGVTIYMPRQECRERRDECQDRTCEKMDNLHESIAAVLTEISKMNRFLGQVEQYMKEQSDRG
jgi:hypothetical protein